jgi:hypothetical protein
MDFQYLFEAAATFIGVIMGVILKTLWTANRDLTTKVQAIELLVAGQYVNKLEFREFSEVLMRKLDRIEERVEKKADK